MKILNISIAFMILACVGCSSCKTESPGTCAKAPQSAQPSAAKTSSAVSIKGTSWTPVFLKNQGDAKCPDASDNDWGTVFISFNPDGKVNGMSGANLFGGTYEIGKDGSIKFSQMLSTRRMGKFAAYETKFLTALSQVDKVSVSGGELILSKGGEALIKFKQIENPKK